MSNPGSDAIVGETSLPALLATLRPALAPETYVFATIPHTQNQPPSLPLPLDSVLFLFREAEGTTLVTTLEDASRLGLTYTFPCRLITCRVHSSLEAVGMMARIATDLAAAGVACNPVSGYYHDHLFVPVGKEAVAIEVLEGIARDAKAKLSR